MKNVIYINAGAGSGKTYTLTKKLAEEISHGKVQPSQVILTTFTELAATEFKEKAREQILAAAQGTLTAANLEAAAQLDSAVIGTVHSMALHFIKKFWYLLDYGADLQTISERDDEFFMNQSLARIVQDKNPNNGTLKYQNQLKCFNDFRDYFDIHNGNRPDFHFWQPILREVVEKMEYYEVNDVKESIHRSFVTIREVYNGRMFDDQQLKDDLVDNLNAYSDFCNDLFNGKYKNSNSKDKANRHRNSASLLADRISDPAFDCRELYEEYVNKDNTLKDLLEPAGGQAARDNCPEYYIFQDIIEKELPTSQSHRRILMDLVRSIFELAKAWRDDFKTYKKNNHIISYNDMEQLFLQLITKEKEVRDYIKEHYRLVMVDEFQDSNPIQLKIFNELSELVSEQGGQSFWVGDPKQSIYGFRGADTELVNEVAQIFLNQDKTNNPDKLEMQCLVESWRSREKLVNLVNDTFKDPFHKKDHIPVNLITLNPHFTENHPDYKKVNINPIVHWECTLKSKPDAAGFLAAKIKDLLNSKIEVHPDKLDKDTAEIHPRDVAILCRTNSDAKSIVKALRKIEVPVSEPEDSIMQRIEVQLVVTLLQFVQNPTNKHVRADILRLLKGMPTEKILKSRIDYVKKMSRKESSGKDAEDEWLNDNKLIQQLTNFTKRLKHLSIPEIVDALIYECDIPALTAMWNYASIRRQNLSTLRHLATDYDQRCLQLGLGTSVNGFIYFLNSTEPNKEKDNQSDTVKVFTYHGSKGLEWSIVILSSINNDALDDNNCVKNSFMTVREMVLNSTGNPFKKTYYLHYFPNTLNGKSSSENPNKGVVCRLLGYPLYQNIKNKVEKEERQLMYVGMTRAKDCLCTLGHGGPDPKPDKKGVSKKSSMQKKEFLWLENIGVVTPTVDNVWGNTSYLPSSWPGTSLAPTGTAASIQATTWEKVIKPKKHTDFQKRYLSPSKIENVDGIKIYQSFQPWDVKGVGTDKSNLKGDYATIGSCIHDFFAVYQPGANVRNRELAQSIINGYRLPSLIQNIDDFIKAADWLYEQLRMKFPPTAESDHVETEVPFQATLPSGQTLRGEMDLLWFYTDNTGKQHCVLVDYKTFPGVDYTQHTLKNIPQLSAYTHALRHARIDVTHALIYYPIGGVVHDLKM